MTANEIIKALECCTGQGCLGCPLYQPKVTGSCVKSAFLAALDLIKRQQAEIERLNDTNKQYETDNFNANMNLECVQQQLDAIIKTYKECAMETVRDFAERIKATFPPRDKCTLDDCYTLDKIDEIVAEMDGKR